eukprot:Blabericola_migrator_1__12837@NODE_831_length_6355_cov_152_596056_g586_i0_p1_GENE_NODE_831_length_6355_cov_152_596056_g586_i0NODE_831_length_6355_cov_152_596056_g586_i0_p1_ORF_typecomplete_len919_score149_63HECT/PF00632_25/4_9e82_NODE_831_length_6355_cov_152_596056_g586_i014764232
MVSSLPEGSAARICFLWENILLVNNDKAPFVTQSEALAEAASANTRGLTLDAFFTTSDDHAAELLQADLAKLLPGPFRDTYYPKMVQAYRDFIKADTAFHTHAANPMSLRPAELIDIIDGILGTPTGVGFFARLQAFDVSNLGPAIESRVLSELFRLIQACDSHLASLLSTGSRCDDTATGKFGVVHLDVDNRFQRYTMTVIEKMADKCQSISPHITSAVQLRFVLIYLNCPFFSDELEYAGILEICRCATKLSEIGKEVLRSWFTHCSLADLDRHAEDLRGMITVRICEHLENSEGRYVGTRELEGVAATYIRHGLSLLQLLYDANLERKRLQEAQEMTVHFYKEHRPGAELHPTTLRPIQRNYLSRTEFYNDGINQKVEIIYEDFKEWLWQSDHYTFGVLEHPFVLDAAGKAKLLAFDSTLRQKIESSRSIPFRFRGGTHLFLDVRRDRLVEDALNQLTRAQGGGRRLNSSRLKSPLRVKFQGEEGVDQGGVAKEFFQLLVQQLFNVEYGMFQYHEETRYFSFKADSLEGLVQFELIGMVLGLALYNQIILDVHFPPVVYKKLLSGNDSVSPPGDAKEKGRAWKAFHMTSPSDRVTSAMHEPDTHTEAPPSGGEAETQGPSAEPAPREGGPLGFLNALVYSSPGDRWPEVARWRLPPGVELSELEMVHKMACSLPPYEPCLEDLEDFEPEIAANLRKILQMPESVVESLGLTWSIVVERYGEMIEVPLVPPSREPGTPMIGGSSCALTAENREAYVKAVLKYRLVDCAKQQFDAFYKGFHRCCGGPVLELFDPAELHLVICGSPGDLDFSELAKGTRYDGFTPDSPIIKHFWEVVNAYSQEDKKKLLFFVTGSDRTPVAGLASIKMIIAKGGGEKHRLPTARTCFNYLFLPDYETKEELERNLRRALENRHGFYLE